MAGGHGLRPCRKSQLLRFTAQLKAAPSRKAVGRPSTTPSLFFPAYQGLRPGLFVFRRVWAFLVFWGSGRIKAQPSPKKPVLAPTLALALYTS